MPVASEMSAAACANRVLTLVVRDDALEAVIGVERALAQESRLVRLDAEPEVDDRVDAGMAGDELHHLGNRVAGLAAREVDRDCCGSTAAGASRRSRRAGRRGATRAPDRARARSHRR